ncbi:MAG: Gfo/Idh/MocA family oxidoreductase, partial [Candidatus Glassbacteria bacterium]|nr:Gfo/Idh/MocA family oxidoreductase [Candidatus Glassbacteria bacterium]
MSLGVIVVSPGWVAGEHIRAFQRNPHTHVAAIVALRESERLRAGQYRERFGLDCRVAEDYGDVLAMEEAQIVTVCSINCFHYQHTLAAL